MSLLHRFLATGAPVPPANYIEDVFSTWLYTGNGSTQTITNGIDLSTKGGLTWIKARSGPSTQSNWLFDTARGAGVGLRSNTTQAEYNGQGTDWTQSFLSTGFSFNSSNGAVNNSSYTYASWTFREQPKFFDSVTYTGNGANRTIAHSLGSVPGCIMVKRTDATADWQVYHRSLTSAAYGIQLNLTDAQTLDTTRWNSTTPTASVFSLGTDASVNASGGTYVAYLFAHNAGGFGLTGTDNVISCGSFTTDGSGNASVNLGYEPQYCLFKATVANIPADWFIVDSMRGFTASGLSPNLKPNSTAIEDIPGGMVCTSTGFRWELGQASKTFIYIAIRRGPMKVPTLGTSVFLPNDGTGSTSGQTISTTFPVDLAMSAYKTQGYVGLSNDRLRGIANTNTAGATPALQTSTTDAESAFSAANPWFIKAVNNSITRGSNAADPSGGIVTWLFGRAPSFFDEVCYTGTGISGQTYAHNLGVVPELMFVKKRSGGGNWQVYTAANTATNVMYLNTTNASFSDSGSWANTAPTASVFAVGVNGDCNDNNGKYVAYLFATCPGVSKVGSYTGNGSSQTINCGFTTGARFVLIKRTDSTGNWVVADSARGLVAAADPALYLNSTAAEVTGVDWIDPDNSGFIIIQEATFNLNVNGASYIYLAIA